MVTTERSFPVLGNAQAPACFESSDFAPGIEKIFALRPSERSYWIDEIEGQIPTFVCGSYYLNGPALFSRAGLHYRHWLDGDGMICSLRFGKDGVRFTNRFVRTNKFTAEEAAGRPIFRTFGTAFAGDILKRGFALESAANVSVYRFNDALLAFGEQSLPWRLDPDTLETIGQFNFGASLTEVSPFSAHPKVDPITGEMFNFGVSFASQVSKLHFYCFDSEGTLKHRTSHKLDYSCSIHDFSLSPNYALFYTSPYILDVDKMIRGGSSLMDSLCWERERGSRLLLIPRHTGDSVKMIDLPAGYCLHLIGSFEEDQKLFVDVIELERPIYDQYQPLPDLFTEPPIGGPVRLIVDLRKPRLLDRHELDYRLTPDFPTVDPKLSTQPYSDFWMLGLSATGRKGRKFFDQLVHARWGQPDSIDLFHAAPRHYLGGEPIFIRDLYSEDGAVICQQFDSDRARSEFLIFNAFNVAAGPVATLRLKEPIYLAFHASFHRT
jgi:all-trans-8'-apo-beta-carotenal 15,15'-oxygenase